MTSGGFFFELRRRNVFKVAIAYTILSWVLIQVADVLFPALNLPDWSIPLVVALLIIGFIPALLFSWVYELTPEGLKRESEVDPTQSATAETGRRLNLITIGLLSGVLCVVLVDHFLLDREDRVLAPESLDTSSEMSSQSLVEDESKPFLAVLPFKVIGSDDGGFLANGLHDDLLTRLAKLGAFKVISRTSMMEYKDTTKNMRQIGEELGAGYILEGAVQAMGDRVRINAQLIDAITDEHLWADSYDRDLTATDLFDIQAELAVAIAGQLQTTLSDSAKYSISHIPTDNTEAYTAYLLGLELRTKPYSVSNQTALEAAFQNAVSHDQKFALAWAHLSMARSTGAFFLTDHEEKQLKYEQALDALERARQLQPDLLETQLAWIYYLSTLWDSKRALAEMEGLGNRIDSFPEALYLKSRLQSDVGDTKAGYATLLQAHRLAPRDSKILANLILQAVGSFKCNAADVHTRSALSVDPENASVRTTAAYYELSCTGDAQRASQLLRDVDLGLGFTVLVARAAARAERDYERLLELTDFPTTGNTLLLPVWDLLDRYDALNHLGLEADAENTLDKAGNLLVELEKEGYVIDDIYYPSTKAWYYSLRGDVGATRQWLEDDLKKAKEPNSYHSDIHLIRAVILARIGREIDAIEELRRMLERPGNWTFQYFDLMPQFDNLKENPGYEALRMEFGDAHWNATSSLR